jgi:thymidylate kinase
MENIETQRKVSQIYQKYITNGQLHKINGDQPKKAVAKQVLQAVIAFLDSR